MCSGIFDNYSIEALGRINATFLHSTYTLVTWAVPVFLMITGALFLNSEKEVLPFKIRAYVVRMEIVIIVMGGFVTGINV